MNTHPIIILILILLATTAASIGVALTERQAAQAAAQEAAQQPDRVHIAAMERDLVAAKRDIAYARNRSATLERELDNLQSKAER